MSDDAIYRKGHEPFNIEAAHAGAAQVFAGRIIRAYMHRATGGGDLDGADVQEWLLRSGLCEQVEMAEPCGDHCFCAEVVGFPTQCCRLTDAGRAALQAERETRKWRRIRDGGVLSGDGAEELIERREASE